MQGDESLSNNPLGLSRNLTQLPGTLCWMRVRTGEAQDVANLIHPLNEGYKHGLFPNTCVGWYKNNRFHSSFLWKSMATRTLALASSPSLNWGPGKGCGSQKLFQTRATFPNSSPRNKMPISTEQGRQSITRQLLVGF